MLLLLTFLLLTKNSPVPDLPPTGDIPPIYEIPTNTNENIPKKPTPTTPKKTEVKKVPVIQVVNLPDTSLPPSETITITPIRRNGGGGSSSNIALASTLIAPTGVITYDNIDGEINSTYTNGLGSFIPQVSGEISDFVSSFNTAFFSGQNESTKTIGFVLGTGVYGVGSNLDCSTPTQTFTAWGFDTASRVITYPTPLQLTEKVNFNIWEGTECNLTEGETYYIQQKQDSTCLQGGNCALLLPDSTEDPSPTSSQSSSNGAVQVYVIGTPLDEDNVSLNTPADGATDVSPIITFSGTYSVISPTQLTNIGISLISSTTNNKINCGTITGDTGTFSCTFLGNTNTHYQAVAILYINGEDIVNGENSVFSHDGLNILFNDFDTGETITGIGGTIPDSCGFLDMFCWFQKILGFLGGIITDVVDQFKNLPQTLQAFFPFNLLADLTNIINTSFENKTSTSIGDVDVNILGSSMTIFTMDGLQDLMGTTAVNLIKSILDIVLYSAFVMMIYSSITKLRFKS